MLMVHTLIKLLFQAQDSATNRVAGFTCKLILCDHTSCVTSLVLVGREHGYDSTYLVSYVAAKI